VDSSFITCRRSNRNFKIPSTFLIVDKLARLILTIQLGTKCSISSSDNVIVMFLFESALNLPLTLTRP